MTTDKLTISIRLGLMIDEIDEILEGIEDMSCYGLLLQSREVFRGIKRMYE